MQRAFALASCTQMEGNERPRKKKKYISEGRGSLFSMLPRVKAPSEFPVITHGSTIFPGGFFHRLISGKTAFRRRDHKTAISGSVAEKQKRGCSPLCHSALVRWKVPSLLGQRTFFFLFFLSPVRLLPHSWNIKSLYDLTLYFLRRVKDISR